MSSSPIATTPSKTSFTAALQSSLNESPSEALRRLSLGIANGTIKMPDTPELRDLRKLASCEKEDTSGVRQSTINDRKEEKRPSLALEVDPALINYIRKFASSDELQQVEVAKRSAEIDLVDGDQYAYVIGGRVKSRGVKGWRKLCVSK
ncbi:hypothetical protein DV737_g4402, partial [Chaetothyriales sp. CBS 132003]